MLKGKRIVVGGLCVALCGALCLAAYGHHTDVELSRPQYDRADVVVSATAFKETFSGSTTGFLTGSFTISEHVGLKVTSSTAGPGVPEVMGYGLSRGNFSLTTTAGLYSGEYRVALDPNSAYDGYGRLWGVGPGGAFEGALKVDESQYPTMNGVLSFVQHNGKQIAEELLYLSGTRDLGDPNLIQHEQLTGVNLTISHSQVGSGVATGPYAVGTINSDGNPGLTSIWVNDTVPFVLPGEGASWGPLSTTTHLGSAYLRMQQESAVGAGNGMVEFNDHYAPEATIAGQYVGQKLETFDALLRHQYTPVPEPAGLGLCGLALLALRRKRK